MIGAKGDELNANHRSAESRFQRTTRKDRHICERHPIEYEQSNTPNSEFPRHRARIATI